MSKTLLTLYAIRNKEGKWMRSKGYGGQGEKWVDDLGKAKNYPKQGTARAQVTFWANAFPKYGIPELVELRVNETVVLDETKRVNKSIERKKMKEHQMALDRAAWKKEQLEHQILENQKELAKLKRVR